MIKVYLLNLKIIFIIKILNLTKFTKQNINLNNFLIMTFYKIHNFSIINFYK